jgi:hypothetical protein
MTRFAAAAVATLAVLALCGCEPRRKAASGFHLPDGDPARGQVAFVELRCNACHAVHGTELPPPVAEPPVPKLGGRTSVLRTDGELVAAILDPSHRITRGHLPDVRAGSLSRMGDFTEAMTARQLVDLVAFIHARTELDPPRYQK